MDYFFGEIVFEQKEQQLKYPCRIQNILQPWPFPVADHSQRLRN